MTAAFTMSTFADKFNKIAPWRSQRVAPLDTEKEFPPLTESIQFKPITTSTISIAERLKQSIAKEEEAAKLRRYTSMQQQVESSADEVLNLNTSSLLIKKTRAHKQIEEAKKFAMQIEEQAKQIEQE